MKNTKYAILIVGLGGYRLVIKNNQQKQRLLLPQHRLVNVPFTQKTILPSTANDKQPRAAETQNQTVSADSHTSNVTSRFDIIASILTSKT